MKPASGDQDPAGEKSNDGEKSRNVREGQPEQTPGLEEPPAGESRDGEKPTQPGEPQPSSKNGKESQPPAAGAKEAKPPTRNPETARKNRTNPAPVSRAQGLECVARELKGTRGSTRPCRRRSRASPRIEARSSEVAGARPAAGKPRPRTRRPSRRTLRIAGPTAHPPPVECRASRARRRAVASLSGAGQRPDPARRRRRTPRYGRHGQAGDSAGKNPREPKLAPSGATELVDALDAGTHDSSLKNPGMPVSPRIPPAAAVQHPRGASTTASARPPSAPSAVEQQAVPSQYSPFVKRVFRRYVDRVGTATPGAAPQTPATPDAPDAPRGPRR